VKITRLKIALRDVKAMALSIDAASIGLTPGAAQSIGRPPVTGIIAPDI
jgi:hypothetical protein